MSLTITDGVITASDAPANPIIIDGVVQPAVTESDMVGFTGLRVEPRVSGIPVVQLQQLVLDPIGVTPKTGVLSFGSEEPAELPPVKYKPAGQGETRLVGEDGMTFLIGI